MEQLAPHALLDIIVLTAKALLGVEIIIIKMKQEKQTVKPVQMAHLAQTLQVLHVQHVTENAQPAIKALQIVKVAKAETTYQAQVATHALLMQVVAVEQTVIAVIQTHISMAQTAQHALRMLHVTEVQTGIATHIIQNREILALERHAPIINISREQRATHVLPTLHVMEALVIAVIADIRCKMEVALLLTNNPYAKTQGYALLAETSAEIGC